MKKLYSNIGKKLMTFAVVIAIIITAIGVIAGLVMITQSIAGGLVFIILYPVIGYFRFMRSESSYNRLKALNAVFRSNPMKTLQNNNEKRRGFPHLSFLYEFLKLNVLIERTVSSTSSVVLTFLIHTECVPRCRTEDFIFGNIMHTNGNSEH